MRTKNLLFPLSILLGLNFLFSLAHAQVCVEKRLDAKNGPMAHIPAVNQAKSDLCYAVVAAQMADAYRSAKQTLPGNHRTAILPTAAYFSSKHRSLINKLSENPKNDGLDFGDIRLAYYVIRERGSCSAKNLFSKDFDELQWKVGHLRESYRQFKKSKSTQTILSTLANTNFSPQAQQALGNLNFLESGESFISFTDKVFTQACEGLTTDMKDLPDLQLKELKSLNSPEARADFLLTAVQQNIVEQNLPISINVCKEALFSSSVRGLEADGQMTEDCGLHGAMIIGINKSCEVLVRNTYPCDIKSDYFSKCEDSHTWIPAKDLGRNVMNYLEFKP